MVNLSQYRLCVYTVCKPSKGNRARRLEYEATGVGGERGWGGEEGEGGRGRRGRDSPGIETSARGLLTTVTTINLKWWLLGHSLVYIYAT